MGIEPAGRAVSEPVTDDSMAAALTAVAKGDCSQYNKFLAELKEVQLEDPASLSELAARLNALSQTVSYIDERLHEALLSHVLGMSVWVYDNQVADSLLRFVVNLVTANGACITLCLDMLVRNFLPPSCGLQAFIDSYHKFKFKSMSAAVDRAHSVKSEHMAKKDEVLDRLHAAICLILELVPMAYVRLQRMVLKRIPHKVTAKEWIALYLENMLRMESKALGDVTCGQMLPAIVDKLIEIDVEIRWEDILRDEDTSKVYLFHMDLEDNDDNDRDRDEENLEVSDPSGPGSEAKAQHGLLSRSRRDKAPSLDAMADKMDLLMDMMLQHLQSCGDKGCTPQVFKVLMCSFQSTILDTYKSKFTQFLLFYLCSLSPATCGRSFASILCDILTSKSRPPNTRMSAAAYLASYLARAKYLSLGVIIDSLKRLVDWCICYVHSYDSERIPNVNFNVVHGVFYSACQAVMYVLCFKLRNLSEHSEHKRVLRSLPLKELFDHRLNPLKMCLPSVVEEFVRQTHSLQLLDYRDLAEQNKNESLQSLGSFGGEYQLDMFFPFDPYLLRQSERHIRPNFLYWSMVHPPSEEYISDLDEVQDIDMEDGAGSSYETMDGPKSLMSELDDGPKSLASDLEDGCKSRMSEMECIPGSQSYCQDGQAPDDEYGFSFESIGHMSISKLPAKLPAVLQRSH